MCCKRKRLWLLTFITTIALLWPFYITSAEADVNLVELAKKVRPAVVLIETFDKEKKPVGQGSGFFINDKGHLITNHHVIERAYSATIKTVTGKRYSVEGVLAAEINADAVKLLVNVGGSKVPFLTPVAVLPSVGEDIAVVGNPFGLESTVSKGIVSAVRKVPTFGYIVQISAPISPGSSGSPVLNMKGQVVGIAMFVLTEGQSLNFAVPSQTIMDLEPTGRVMRLPEYAKALTKQENGATSRSPKSRRGRFEDMTHASLKFYEQMAEEYPKDSYGYLWAQMSMAGFLKTLGRFKEAEEIYRKSIPLCKAIIEKSAKESSDDFRPFDFKALELLPCTYGYLGRCYEELGQYQEATQAYQEAINAFNLGEKSCKKAVQIDPNNDTARSALVVLNYHQESAYSNIGHSYKALGKYQDAVKAYEQAMRVALDFSDTDLSLFYICDIGYSYIELNRFEEAIQVAKKVIGIKPNYVSAKRLLGHAYSNLGRYEEAKEALKEAIRTVPDFEESHYNLGVVYTKLSRYEEAIKAYKQAIRINPDYAEAHWGVGLSYSQLGHYKEAIQACKQAVKIKPDFAQAHFSLGLDYLIMGDTGSAFNEYKTLKTLDKDLANKLFDFIYE